jgi:cytidine deaminase
MDDLIDAAKQAREQAYAPYSNFKVGVAVRGQSGRIYAGCNVENAAYPQGWCAEASALAMMILAGERELAEVAVLADGPDLVTPCGGCRQKLREFGRPELPIHLCTSAGLQRSISLGELLPLAFGPAHLQ